ncbi:MAG TPA: hypothetical protein VF382_04700 [Actinomycetota bacterium]
MPRIQVDGFLADSVVRADGKLYVQGAGWNRITASLFPVVHDRIGIGLLFRVEPGGASEPHRFELRLEDAEGKELPLGNAPSAASQPGGGKIYRIGGEFTTGRGDEGEEQLVPMAINFNGMPFDRPGAYRFVVSVDGSEVKTLPFRILALASQAPQVTGGGGYL